MSEPAEEPEALEIPPPVEADVPPILPVLPLRETVVYPDAMSPLAIGQERSIALIDEAIAGNRMIALLASKNPESEVPGPDDMYTIGTAAVIHRMLRIPDGTIRILVQGIRRIRLERFTQEEPYLVGEFVEVPDVVPDTPEVKALSKNVQGLFSKIIDLAPYLPAELELAVANVDAPGELTYLIASTMRIGVDEKQELLEEANVETRLRDLSVILSRELESFELGAKIQSQVQSEMEKSQREYFLRQQLKAIQDELGEGDPDQAELTELRRQLDEAGLPEEADRQARRELDRLTRLPSAAAEYGVIRTYLDWILSLPWNVTTEDDLDLRRAQTHPRRGSLRPREGQGADRRVPRRLEAEARSLRPDSLLRRPTRRRQDLPRPVDRAHARPEVRAHLGRRGPGRVRDPRPQANVHRIDARDDHPGDP